MLIFSVDLNFTFSKYIGNKILTFLFLVFANISFKSIQYGKKFDFQKSLLFKENTAMISRFGNSP